MNTTVKSLQDAYVSLGGELTDTYEDIDNGTPVSDYTTIPDVIEAIAQIAAKTLELPTTTSADKGSVLMVNEEGNWDKGDAPTELPAVTAEDAGKILSVTEQGEWAPETPSGGLPDVTTDDVGKALLVARSGPSTVEWRVGSVFKTMTFSNLSTDENGKITSLGASGTALNNAKILNVRFSDSYTLQPTDYNVEVRQSRNSQYHYTTNDFYIKASGDAWANKSGISIDVTYI